MSFIDSWEAFIRLHGGIVGARDCFEQACADLLQAENSGKDVHRIDSAGGDGGIDVYVSNDDGTVDIYQCKFFIDHLESSKWAQIKGSFMTLLAKHPELNVSTWYLCLPKLMSAGEISKYEEFKEKMADEGICIRLIDGENLISRMKKVGLGEKWFNPNESTTSSQQLIPIYLSYPTPHTKLQQRFISFLINDLKNRGLNPRNMGTSEYSMDVPLKAISRIIAESQGCLCVAFRRIYIASAINKKGANLPDHNEKKLSGYWYSSPFSHIEPAMAYQMRLPILILKEKDVYSDGMLEVSNQAPYIPVFELNNDTVIEDFFNTLEYRSLIDEFTRKVMKTSKPINRECTIEEFFSDDF